MMENSTPVKKKAVSGSIDPRWPKSKVVRWLEVGAVPAIVGLWFPDWLGAYGAGAVPYIPPLLAPFPPLLVFVGAVILIVGCYQGVRGMGSHFRGVIVSGAGAGIFAILSVVAQVLGYSSVALLLTGLAAVSATGALWFTIGKVADITQESRARYTWWAIALFTSLTAFTYLVGLYVFTTSGASGLTLMRVGVLLLTITFGLCRYGVHCYKTQTSIGAGFRSDPNEQYWAVPDGGSQ